MHIKHMEWRTGEHGCASRREKERERKRVREREGEREKEKEREKGRKRKRKRREKEKEREAELYHRLSYTTLFILPSLSPYGVIASGSDGLLEHAIKSLPTAGDLVA